MSFFEFAKRRKSQTGSSLTPTTPASTSLPPIPDDSVKDTASSVAGDDTGSVGRGVTPAGETDTQDSSVKEASVEVPNVGQEGEGSVDPISQQDSSSVSHQDSRNHVTVRHDEALKVDDYSSDARRSTTPISVQPPLSEHAPVSDAEDTKAKDVTERVRSPLTSSIPPISPYMSPPINLDAYPPLAMDNEPGTPTMEDLLLQSDNVEDDSVTNRMVMDDPTKDDEDDEEILPKHKAKAPAPPPRKSPSPPPVVASTLKPSAFSSPLTDPSESVSKASTAEPEEDIAPPASNSDTVAIANDIKKVEEDMDDKDEGEGDQHSSSDAEKKSSTKPPRASLLIPKATPSAPMLNDNDLSAVARKLQMAAAAEEDKSSANKKPPTEPRHGRGPPAPSDKNQPPNGAVAEEGEIMSSPTGSSRRPPYDSHMSSNGGMRRTPGPPTQPRSYVGSRGSPPPGSSSSSFRGRPIVNRLGPPQRQGGGGNGPGLPSGPRALRDPPGSVGGGPGPPSATGRGGSRPWERDDRNWSRDDRDWRGGGSDSDHRRGSWRSSSRGRWNGN